MKLLVDYAESFIGAPYRWGGSGPAFDCSGYVQELLSFCGIDPAGDQNAQAFHDYFKTNGIGTLKDTGALVFYGKDETKITHIEMLLGPNVTIGAIGGGSGTQSEEAAIKYGAFVKKRHFGYRLDIIAVYMPKYPKWVLDGKT